MNRLNQVISVGALVAAVGAAVSLGFQPETTRPTQPSTQPGTQPSTQPGRDFQPTTPGRDNNPSLTQPGRDTLSQPGSGFNFQQGQKVSRDQVERLISGWPQESKKAAQATLEKYGPPDGGTFQELIWHDAGPWHKVVVSSEPHDHNFPMPHKDVLMGCIKHKVPQEKVADLIAFDGSLVFNHTAGTLAAICDKEEANFAALNIAHDIIQGSKSVQEAKEQMAKVMMGLMQGTKDPITQEFKFEMDDDTAMPGQPHRGQPGMDRPGTDPERTPRIDPLPGRTPGMDPQPGRNNPGVEPVRPTPPRDPMNPSPTDPTLPRRPGGG